LQGVVAARREKQGAKRRQDGMELFHAAPSCNVRAARTIASGAA
jgi:hypothetical protein